MKTAVLVPASVLALAVVSWWMTSRSRSSPPAPVLVAGVLAREVNPSTGVSPSEARIEGIGFIEPLTEVRKLVFKADGVIARCAVEVGRTCTKGDVLMELDNREQRAAIAVAEAEWALARADQARVLSGTDPHQIESAVHRVEALREQERFWNREHERYATLAPRGAASRSEYDRTASERNQRQAELQQAEADLRHLRHAVRDEDRRLAEARVAASKARLDLEREELEGTILHAPCDGTVLDVLKREGEGARRVDAESVVLFADTSRLRVRAEVDERFVGDLRVGQNAVVFGRGLRDRQYSGRVVLVKAIMGRKTVFSRSAAERMDLDVVQVIVEVEGNLAAPVGLEVRVAIYADAAPL